MSHLTDTRNKLITFATKHRLRKDWHEPDEQGITAIVTGCILDNAMGDTNKPTPDTPMYWQELTVHLFASDDGLENESLSVNLATVLSLAATPTQDDDLELLRNKLTAALAVANSSFEPNDMKWHRWPSELPISNRPLWVHNAFDGSTFMALRNQYTLYRYNDNEGKLVGVKYDDCLYWTYHVFGASLPELPSPE